LSATHRESGASREAGGQRKKGAGASSLRDISTEPAIQYTAVKTPKIGVIFTRFFLQNDILAIIFQEIRNRAG